MVPANQVHHSGISTAVTLAYFVIYVWSWGLAFVDLRRHSEADFAQIGRNKFNWMVALFLLGAFAAVPYLIKVRPRLRSASS